MLQALGLSALTENVYRTLLAEPDWGVDRIATHLHLSEAETREALDELLELTLLRPATDSHALRTVSPEVGLTRLLAQNQNQLLLRQQQLESTRTAIAALSAEHIDRRPDDEMVVRLDSLDAVRDRLEELAATATQECLSLMRGGAVRPDSIQAGKHPNQLALERGVVIRSIFQDSFRNDPETLRYARWLADLGGLTRTVPLLPIRLVIVDRSIALVPTDPSDGRRGALELHGEALIQPLCALFDELWRSGADFGQPAPRDDQDLTGSERALLQLLGHGHTDQSASRKLGLSLRTVRRMMQDLMNRLGAESRFQAGAEAARKDWL
ncbi:DNA-binding CsgD family transcriptional regulator/AraC-like DNA-binding protein [Kitasatospora gansuensis]|uniref:DNA-binding CsgD family transcriptional regulator/AraC-like DNA-binding protein n=1 Tax=Kitasatospora gansuensis TaxID=258050 RepID=A0A7W7WFP4_9ACTN|nr:helix-turn-helix transcriptional regulator [Kitasatospora gansuensis]MBB4945987.1 DNA-binding CsgD family transcriptional regulator/AraC-like DNA-binding protein [Kitasatospora gansuensis]